VTAAPGIKKRKMRDFVPVRRVGTFLASPCQGEADA
jgi:hypothetical protein